MSLGRTSPGPEMGRQGDKLAILHVFRAPVGGLFRHVVDLALAQAERGHRVGLIADSTTGGAQAEELLAALSRLLPLGVTRVPMSRHIGLKDVSARDHVARIVRQIGVDVIHGHGAKGGAYARLVGRRSGIRVYTPHGGSLHFRWSSPSGFLYLSLERILMTRTDLILFESNYGYKTFHVKIGRPACDVQVVHNGVAFSEFDPVKLDPRAADLIFVGELRTLKGLDVLIDAIALLRTQGRATTAVIVGDGVDRAVFEAQVTAQDLDQAIKFVGAKPARSAFSLGKVLVVPSRAESLPYIVLEAAAAQVPMIATRVGGIPEIFGPDSGRLVEPGDAAALAGAINAALQDQPSMSTLARRLQDRVRASFSVETMTDAVIAAYRIALARRHG